MKIQQLKKRDGDLCHYCGRCFGTSKWDMATRDHKIPVCKGGTNADDNLVLACGRCNSLKGSCDYDIFIARLPEILAQLERMSLPKVAKVIARQSKRIKEKKVKKAPFTIEFSPDDAYAAALAHYKRFGRRGLSRQWIEIIEEFN